MVQQMPERNKVNWPVRTCREAVWSNGQAYSCEVPDLHEGPCMSLSVQSSVQRRTAWETAQKEIPGEDVSA